jgi:hypothetical protein
VGTHDRRCPELARTRGLRWQQRRRRINERQRRSVHHGRIPEGLRRDEAGENAQLLQVQITAGGAEFTLRNGEQATGFVYTGGDLHDQKVELVGPFSIEGQDFPLSEVDPAAIDKIVSGVQSQSGNSDTKVTVMKLDKQNVENKVQWSIVAEGGGRTGIPYTADPDGSNVSNPLSGIAGSGSGSGGGGGVTAPNGKTAQDIADCIQQAGTDISKIQSCTQ